MSHLCDPFSLSFSLYNLINDTHRENFVLLNSVQEFIEIEAWLLLRFFIVYTQSINFYTPYFYMLKSADV